MLRDSGLVAGGQDEVSQTESRRGDGYGVDRALQAPDVCLVPVETVHRRADAEAPGADSRADAVVGRGIAAPTSGDPAAGRRERHGMRPTQSPIAT